MENRSGKEEYLEEAGCRKKMDKKSKAHTRPTRVSEGTSQEKNLPPLQNQNRNARPPRIYSVS